MSNSTGPLADRYPGGKNGECGAPGFEHRVGFFPQLPVAAVPVSLAPGFVAGRVEEENHLLESFARKCLEAGCPLGWVLGWLLPLVL